MEAFDSMGGGLYEALYRREQEEKYDLLLSLIEASRGVALDDGCGTGLLLERLGVEAVGLDLSTGLLSTAYSKRIKRTHLVRGDGENLPFRDGVYRYIFAITLINNTPNPFKAMREMRRVSRRGARVAVSALKKFFNRESFLRLLSLSGFRVLHSPPSEDLRDWIAVATPGGGR